MQTSSYGHRRVILTRHLATRSHVSTNVRLDESRDAKTSLLLNSNQNHVTPQRFCCAQQQFKPRDAATSRSGIATRPSSSNHRAQQSLPPRLHPSETCKSKAFELSPNLAEGADKSVRLSLHHSKCKSRALKLLPNTAHAANESANHDYILQRHANQELLSSRQNLAEGADESARPRLQNCKSRALKLLPNSAQAANESARPRLQKCKSRAFKLLPRPCTGPRINKTTFTSLKHATTWDPAKTLLRERIVSKTTFTR